MKITALIPAKGFLNAKRRLSTLLGATEREFLAETMFRDVLRQVLMARGLSATFVVTGSGRVAEIASALGAGVIRERTENGETEAVDLARGQLRRAGCEAVLIVPGDMPLVRSADIEQMVAQVPAGATAPFALVVPSHDRMGTNALLLAPPDLIKLRFGHDSFSFHMSQIAAAGLPPRVLENERIALDIDEPADLRRFLCFGDPANESHAVAHAILEQHAGEQMRRFGGL